MVCCNGLGVVFIFQSTRKKCTYNLLLETARAVESQSEEDEAGDSSDSDDEDFNVPSRRRRFHSSSLDNRAMYRRRNQPIYPSYKKPRMKWWKILLIVLFTMVVISGIFTFLKITKYL